jgi:alpha-L-rhamnosidase
VLGEDADAKRYGALHADIREAFVDAFVDTSDGRVRGGTQTGYLLALAFDLMPGRLSRRPSTTSSPTSRPATGT